MKKSTLWRRTKKLHVTVQELEDIISELQQGNMCSCGGTGMGSMGGLLKPPGGMGKRRSSIVLEPKINLGSLNRRGSMSHPKIVKLVKKNRKKTRNAVGHRRGKHRIEDAIKSVCVNDIVLRTRVCACEFQEEKYDIASDVSKKLIKTNQWLLGSKQAAAVPKVFHYWFELHTTKRYYSIQKTRNGDIHFNVFGDLEALKKKVQDVALGTKSNDVKIIDSLEAANKKELEAMVKLENDIDSVGSDGTVVIRISDVTTFLELIPAVYHVLRSTSKETAMELFNWWKEKF